MSATLSHFRGVNGNPPATTTTFTFDGNQYTVTSVSIQAPEPEVTDMTSPTDGAGKVMLVPTGEFLSPASISVDGYGFFDPKSLSGKIGNYQFVTPGGTLSGRAVCNSVSVDARVGDVLRVSFSLQATDYTGT